MSPMALLLNVLWLVFGGLWTAIGWGIAAVIMAVTIIGIPWARAAFNIGVYTLCRLVSRRCRAKSASAAETSAPVLLGVIGNAVWLVLAGWWLALLHLLFAILLAITIVGIPFAWAHVKLAGIALWPIGKIIVPTTD